MANSDASALMKVLAGILEDAVRALQRIEKKIGDQSKLFEEFTEKIGKIESIITNGISTIAQKEIPSLEKNINQKIDDLGIQSLDEINETLDQTIMKLQRSIQLLSIQNLVSRIENVTTMRNFPQRQPVKEISPKKSTKQKVVPKAKPISKEVTAPPTLSPPPVAKSKNEKSKEKKKKKEDEESLIKPSTFFGS